MNGTIHNEGAFLNNIAKNLGRAPITEGISVPEWKHAPQKEVLKHATQNDLVAELKEQCKRVHTQFHVTDSEASGELLNKGDRGTWKRTRDHP